MDAKATMFAAVSVMPTPAAMVVPMNTLISASVWKASTAA